MPVDRVDDVGLSVPTVKGGEETPETGTPPPGSLSPSSDGGASVHLEQRSVQRGNLASESREVPQIDKGVSDNGSCSSTDNDMKGTRAGIGTTASGISNSRETVSETVSSCSVDGDERGRNCGLSEDHRNGIVAGADRSDRVLFNTARKGSADGSAVDEGPGTGAEFAADRVKDTVVEVPLETVSPLPGFISPHGTVVSKDRRIFDALAAPGKTHQRLVQTASLIPAMLMDPGDRVLATSVELYGSLSLDMAAAEAGWCDKDGGAYYVNKSSDVDFVVQMRHGVPPVFVAHRLLKSGSPWRLVAETLVQKFATTQYTLLGRFDEGEEASDVYLDITCITEAAHFKRFKRRQDAFRKVFSDCRSMMETKFCTHGAVAFDAYVHLLKAFAARVPDNALTGFQATCIGLFTLQNDHFSLHPAQSLALSLFEGFLEFCSEFYRDISQCQNLNSPYFNYQTCAIDLSGGGKWMHRVQQSWRSELYFMATEEDMQVPRDERMNVAHSLDPARVSLETQSLLCGACAGAVDWQCLSFSASFC